MKKIILTCSILFLLISKLVCVPSVELKKDFRNNFYDENPKTLNVSRFSVCLGVFNIDCGMVEIPQSPFKYSYMLSSTRDIYLAVGIGIDVPIQRIIIEIDGSVGVSFLPFEGSSSNQLFHGTIESNALLPLDFLFPVLRNTYLDVGVGVSRLSAMRNLNYYYNFGIGLKYIFK